MLENFNNIRISEYSYSLPEERIAKFPLEKRDDSKLLVYENGEISQTKFFRLPERIPAQTLVVMNDTRVIEARVLFKKETGATIEIFCLEPFEQNIETAILLKEKAVWKCLIGGASKWKPGQVLKKHLNSVDYIEARYIEKKEDYFLIEFSWQPSGRSFIDVIHHAGAIPLPPYIKREIVEEDALRYQTIFSIADGSVAAPTASLHYTREVFEKFKKKNIEQAFLTLHVGAGTFKPVKSEFISEHQMHAEPFTVSRQTVKKLISNQTIIASGTTSLRSLESLYWTGVKIKCQTGSLNTIDQWEAYSLAASFDISKEESLGSILNWMDENNQDHVHCRTSMMIVPGYRFKITQGLITNFHQPNSTLLLLVAAFIGSDWKKVYDYALKNDFRFLSYGDGSLLWRNEGS